MAPNKAPGSKRKIESGSLIERLLLNSDDDCASGLSSKRRRDSVLDFEEDPCNGSDYEEHPGSEMEDIIDNYLKEDNGSNSDHEKEYELLPRSKNKPRPTARRPKPSSLPDSRTPPLPPPAIRGSASIEDRKRRPCPKKKPPAVVSSIGTHFWSSPGEKQYWRPLLPGLAPSNDTVEYEAMLITPAGSSWPMDEEAPDGFPLAFYFSGLGEEASTVMQRAADFARVAQEPFVLVAAQRPAGRWWFIDDDSHWGWIQGKFLPEVLKFFGDWMEDLIHRPGINSERIGLFGFSSGAYAAVEILAGCPLKFSGVGLGGVHGHGQSDLDEIPAKRRSGVIERFNTFLDRLRNHQGVPWIQATHSRDDKQARWQDATAIFDALSERQLELGLPEVDVRWMEPQEQDCAGRKNKSFHHYFKAAFCSTEFLASLFSASQPEDEEENVYGKQRETRTTRFQGEYEREDEEGEEEEDGSQELEEEYEWRDDREQEDEEEFDSEQASHPEGPKAPISCPPTTLDVSRYSTSCEDEDWQELAFDIFAEHGFVVVEQLLQPSQYRKVLGDCQRAAEEMVGQWRSGNRGPGRYSFGKASSSQSMLHVPSFAGDLLGGAGFLLLPLLELIFENDASPGFSCYSASGDFVLGDVHTHQDLHADIQAPKELQKTLPPPYVAVNFCVQPLTPMNGAMRIIPGTQLRKTIPDQEPGTWRNSRLCPIPAGAAIIRDVRVLHGGTPNLTQKTRYLPNIEFVSAEFRATNRKDKFPPSRSLPHHLFEQLPPEVQNLCEELVIAEDEQLKVKFSKR